MTWLSALALHVEPMAEPARMRSGDWRQDAAYPAPLWTDTVAELAPRISVENLDGFYALQLFSRHQPERRAAEILAVAGWTDQRRYRVAVAEAAQPIEEGFLRRVRVWKDHDAPQQPVGVAAVFAELVRVETARIGDIEPWLRARYGRPAPEHPVFEYIDYPVFDCGTMVLGYALLVHGPELHFWSRAAHAHK